MFKGKVNTFALVINYLSNFLNIMDVTIGLFEVHETMGFPMVGQLHTLLEKFDLVHNVITFVKDESNNLMSMVIT
jgi:hypothetical protein